jgi:pyruvate carboxylase
MKKKSKKSDGIQFIDPLVMNMEVLGTKTKKAKIKPKKKIIEEEEEEEEEEEYDEEELFNKRDEERRKEFENPKKAKAKPKKKIIEEEEDYDIDDPSVDIEEGDFIIDPYEGLERPKKKLTAEELFNIRDAEKRRLFDLAESRSRKPQKQFTDLERQSFGYGMYDNTKESFNNPIFGRMLQIQNERYISRWAKPRNMEMQPRSM